MSGGQPIVVAAPAALDVFITEELNSRVPRKTDYLQEKLALQDLARAMVDNPDTVLGLLVEQGMELTGATSAGISLYEPEPEPVFRWHHLCGELAGFNGATTPRNYSPCGVTLDHNKPMLCKHPELAYSWIADAGITLKEVLLVPLYIGGDLPLGTLWLTAQEQGYFDSGHARVLSELAAFAGIALHMARGERNLHAALRRQEQLTREMSHRLHNVFTVFDGLARMTARSAKSAKEMETALAGRVSALAKAHALARVIPHEGAGDAAGLHGLIVAVLRPYEDSTEFTRVRLDGEDVPIGENAMGVLALIFHELATNAAKYGAIGVPEGGVNVAWRADNENLVLSWREENGPRISGPPHKAGFGTNLTQGSVEQFGGTISRDWRETGLQVEISVPLASLRN